MRMLYNALRTIGLVACVATYSAGVSIAAAKGGHVPPGLTSGGPQPQTPQEVWAGFDPRSEPLEIETIKEWTEEGARHLEFYFRGETYDNAPVRVYAIYAAPQGGKNLPGLLHIHGGGQTASPNWLKFWTAHGYAAMSFDFCGAHEGRTRFTRYGKLLQGNQGQGKNMAETTEPSVRASKWYHWTLLARRCLTVLERMPEVDPNRLGIYGISVGGSLVWYVAGSDDRVKAACAIYGCGWNTHPRSMYEDDPKKDDPSMVLWRKTMEPEAYAPLIACPLLFLDGTNDHHGKMDWAYQTLGSMKAPCYAAFTPHYRHHVEEEQGRDLPLFMDKCLRNGPAWLKSPALAIALDAVGVPVAQLKADLSQPIKKVEIYYAVSNDNPITRFWRLASAGREGEMWTASLPILSPQDRLFGFANVVYPSGLCLSSNFQAVIPSKLGPAKATDQRSLVIGDFNRGIDGFTTSSPGTDPNSFNTVMETRIGPDGIACLHMIGRVTLRTEKLGDPKWQAPADAQLGFLVQAPRPAEFDVVLIKNDYTPGAQQYVHHLRLEKKPGWQAVVLSASDFKDPKGQSPDNWAGCGTLEFGAKGGGRTDGVSFARIRWIVPASH